MPRLFSAIVLCCGLCELIAADVSPAGYWKLNVPFAQQDVQLLLVFTNQNGQWVGDYGGSSVPIAKTEPKLSSVTVDGPHVTYTLKLGERDFLSFDGILSADGKTLSGSLTLLGGNPQLTVMQRTKLKRLDDAYAVALETFQQAPDGPSLFELGFELVRGASARKLPIEEVRGMVERLNRVAGDYGPRWDRHVTLRLAEALQGQNGLEDVALAQARRAERMISETDSPSVVMETLMLVQTALQNAGKADEAKPYATRIARLEARDYAEYIKAYPPFPAEAYAGRKGMSQRGVLVEVMSGTNLPTSVATDLAADVLQRTYQPSEVIVLHYHLHLNGVDPLTSPQGVERLSDFARKLRREDFPFVAVAGKPVVKGGGLLSDTQAFYKDLRRVIDEELEKPAPVKLTLTAEKTEAGYTLKAAVNDLANPGESLTLRLALAESKVRYRGTNGLRYHHMVVRAMPAGPRGIPLTKNNQEHTVDVNIEAIRKEIREHVEKVLQSEDEQIAGGLPLALTPLKAVAFVVNETTGEVLHAVQIDMP